MIPFIEIVRVAITSEFGAFGVMKHLGVPFAVTLERTYANPAEPVVKIPPGKYRCTKTWFIHGGYWAYEIHVPGHERILIHKGNVQMDVDGCVAVGESFDPVNGTQGIVQSGKGFDEFMRRAANAQEFLIEVSGL